MGTFKPGDVVVDRSIFDEVRRRERRFMRYDLCVVVHDTETEAQVQRVNTLDSTVTELNPEYPPDDNVVKVVFVGGLAREAVGLDDWREEAPTELHSAIRWHREKWDVAPIVYSYPEGRLLPVDPDTVYGDMPHDENTEVKPSMVDA